MKLLLAGVGLVGILLLRSAGESPSVTNAKAFLNTLNATQRTAAVFGLNAEERKAWMYVPGKRKGISWGEMSDPQKAAARKLLDSALSPEGKLKVEAIRELELVLREIENSNMDRDPSRYWFAFYGEPDSNTPWAWRYEGHHCSLTFGYNKGTIISSTPQFLGTNPAEVRSGPKKGTRVLSLEQDLGYKLIECFDPEQRERAIVSTSAPVDVVTGNSRQAMMEDHSGVKISSFNAAQKKVFWNLIQAHANVQTKSEQQRRVQLVKQDKNAVFAWLGSTDHGGKHYYRILGKSFLIEYDNTQNDANHIHTVWRDFNGDFGGDLLAEHYLEDHR